MSDILSEGRKAAAAVYLATDESAARDISRILSALCDEVERLREVMAELWQIVGGRPPEKSTDDLPDAIRDWAFEREQHWRHVAARLYPQDIAEECVTLRTRMAALDAALERIEVAPLYDGAGEQMIEAVRIAIAVRHTTAHV